MVSDAGLDVGGGDGAPLVVSSGADIEGVLSGQPGRVSGPLVDQAPVDIALDAGPAGRWTMRVGRDGRMLRTLGVARHAQATIRADADTLVALLSGRESGVGAFMGGRLTVRGSLGLALLLEGALSPPDRPARFPRTATVAACGIRTPYLEGGPLDAPVVVALHGLGATNASLLPTVWDLATDYRVIAPDLPGFGMADKPIASYSAAWFGRWLEQFCDALGLDRFFLLGNSLGGRVAIEGGLMMPDRVRGLLLLTPSPAFRKLRQFVPLVRLLRPELAVVPLPVGHATAVAGLRKMFAVPDRVREAWYDAAADEFLRVMRDPRGRIAFFSAMRQIYLEEAFGADGFWERLPGLRPPALFVWGDSDRLVPHGFERHVVQALPQCHSVVDRGSAASRALGYRPTGPARGGHSALPGLRWDRHPDGTSDASWEGSIMERMSPLDAGFVDLEDEDRHASLAIASIAVLEGPGPAYEDFLAAIAGKLPLVPHYRHKARHIPFDLGRPVWVDDPNFDLRYHVRQTALPAPGGDEQLRHLLERVMAQRLDRERPLWECWLVEGLEGGRWAVLTKVHHCMVDGVAATDLYRVFFDATPERSPAVEDTWQPRPEPSTLSLTAVALRDLALSPVEQARAVRGALRTPGEVVRRTIAIARGLAALAGAVVPSSVSSLSGPIGRPRRYRPVRLSLADVKAVRKQLGGTVNDVILAAIAGAFRTLLLARGEQPGPHTIRSLVPVSVRAPGEEGIHENRVSLLLASLPVDVADPVERLAAVRTHLEALKASREAEAGAAMTSIAGYEPFPLISLGIRLAFRMPQRNIVTVTTNVPGPRQPLYAMGCRLVEILPYVPIATTVRFGLAIFSYCGQMTVGITGDRASTPDIDVLARGIEDSLAELLAAAERSVAGTAGRRRRGQRLKERV